MIIVEDIDFITILSQESNKGFWNRKRVMWQTMSSASALAPSLIESFRKVSGVQLAV